MVIDFHVHCFPDELAVKAVPKLAQCAGLQPRVDGTVSGIKRSMSKARVSKSVILSIATKPSQTEIINTWSSQIQDDEIIAFGSIHPEYENWRYELQRIKELGVKGIKFHPDYQNFFVDDEKVFPIYELACELDLIVLFHAGVDIGLSEPYHATPQRLKKVVKAFSGAKIVAAHLGSFSYWDDVEEYLVGEDLFFDTSFSLGFVSDEQAKRIFKNHGHKKILFATDSPWGDQLEEIEKLKGLGLDSDMENDILGINAKTLLGL